MGRGRTERADLLAKELRELAMTLVQRLRAVPAGDLLSLPQAMVVARLDKTGPATIADLARAENVKPQSMGVTVGSLEEDGLVARKADPNDARRWNVSLTEAGKRALLAGRAAREAWLSQALEERLEDAEMKHLLVAASLLRKALVP